MDEHINALAYAGALLIAMLALLEIGHRLGVRYAKGSQGKLGNVEGAVFALFGLLLAFTFSGAGTRYDLRRLQITTEANAIGTAYLRLDLLAPADQAPLREQFRDYVTLRLAVFASFPNLAAVKEALVRSDRQQAQIWSSAVRAVGSEGAHHDAALLLLPALNEMIDITSTRTMTARIHPPKVIYALLFTFSLGCSLLAGYGMASGERSWAHILGFVLATVLSLYVILELEYPRQGLLRIDDYDQVLVDLRDSIAVSIHPLSAPPAR